MCKMMKNISQPAGFEPARGDLDELGIVWARRSLARVEHVGDVAHAIDAGVDVDGEGLGSVIVVEQGRVCQPFDDSLHFSFLLLAPSEGGSLLGECPQVLGVLQEDTGE